MTPEQKKLARHALGLPNSRKRSYRNRYHTDAHHPAWKAMVDGAEADYEPIGMGKARFWLTRKGAEAALEPGETLCPEDFPEVTA